MPSKDNLIIRDARGEDIPALTLLMNDLGYPTHVEQMQTPAATASVPLVACV